MTYIIGLIYSLGNSSGGVCRSSAYNLHFINISSNAKGLNKSYSKMMNRFSYIIYRSKHTIHEGLREKALPANVLAMYGVYIILVILQ